MKPFRFLIFSVIVMLFTAILGCSSGDSKVTLTNGEKVIQHEPFDHLSEKQQEDLLRVSPQDLIQKYYGAINEKQYDFALACLDSDFIGNKKEEILSFWKKHYKSIQVVNMSLPDNYKDRQSEVSAFYQVSYTFEKNADDTTQSAETSGINELFIRVEKKSNSKRWMMTAVSSSPI
jgi:hypothetical protein